MESATVGLEITELIHAHHADLYRYAYRLSGSVPDAEDLTQQAFLIAQEKLHQVRDAKRVKGWLYAVLRSCFLKACRKNQPLTATGAELAVDQIPENAVGGEGLEGQDLRRVIGELPDEFRLVVLMFYYEDCSYKEIAAELDIPIGTVMSRLARAKGRIRQVLLDGGYFDGEDEVPGRANSKGSASLASTPGGDSPAQRESR